MRPETRAQIKKHLQTFMERLLIEHKVLPQPRARPGAVRTPEQQPFHEAILTLEIMRASSFERSFSTRLGNTFEQSARLIAAERYDTSIRQYKLFGEAPRSALTAIDSIHSDIDQRGMKRNYRDLATIVASAYSGDSEQLQRPIQVDLFLAGAGVEIYFEMKSPQPNKDQCLGTTAKLLRIHAVRRTAFPTVQTYYAMPYNPYGHRAGYAHSYALQYLDMQNQVLLGEEFWELIGGGGTYDELSDIYREAGRESRELVESLTRPIGP